MKRLIKAASEVNLAFICPSCTNRALYDLDRRKVTSKGDVGYRDHFICDECGTEFLAFPQYDGTIKFKEVSMEDSNMTRDEYEEEYIYGKEDTKKYRHWTDVYKVFNRLIKENIDNGPEAVWDAVDEFYETGKGNKAFDEAYRRWNDPSYDEEVAALEKEPEKPIRYIIQDKHGNQISLPSEDDGKLWDRVTRMENRGVRGLSVVVYMEPTTKVQSSTQLKRIARSGEYDSPYLMRGDWKKMTDEEAEELAKQKSIQDPKSIFYVQYDDVMDPCSLNRWINGQSYNVDEISYDELQKIRRESAKSVKAAEGEEVEDEEITEMDQEFTSEKTSINSTKLPAIFRLAHLTPGTTNLDFGGGKFDNATEYLAEQDITNLIYDPYNRTREHNQSVLSQIRKQGGADTATCSNVLNVIKEPDVRLNVLKNISKLVKPGGQVYFTVHEGSKDGNEGPTKSGYQLNRKTGDYLEEIQQIFPDAKKRGKLIYATNVK